MDKFFDKVHDAEYHHHALSYRETAKVKQYLPSTSNGLCNTHSATDSQSLGFHIAAREEKAFQNMFVRQ